MLTHLHAFIPGYLIDSGDLDGGSSWLALRWRGGITPHLLASAATYRGGMVHFTDPETAAHILATPDDQHIALDERAEVYSLAAVLHLAWTGLPPAAYT